jgi:hypothetical protein
MYYAVSIPYVILGGEFPILMTTATRRKRTIMKVTCCFMVNGDV